MFNPLVDLVENIDIRPTKTNITYTYGVDGIRDSKTVNGTTYSFINQNSQVVRQTGGGHTLDFTYDNAGKPLTLTYDGTTYYYMLNLQGDVIALLDAAGSYKGWYLYDAWGRVLDCHNVEGTNNVASANPLRYRGYYYDTESQLYYLGSRYYDPQVKRFINADAYASTGQDFLGYNMFAYCNNNPVNLTDNGGHLSELAAAAIVGGIAGAVTGALWGGITSAISGGSFAAGALAGGISGGLTGAVAVFSLPLAIGVSAVSSVISYGATAEEPTPLGCVVAGTLGIANGALSFVTGTVSSEAAVSGVTSYFINGASSILTMIGTTITDNQPTPKAPSMSVSTAIYSRKSAYCRQVVKNFHHDPSKYRPQAPGERTVARL